MMDILNISKDAYLSYISQASTGLKADEEIVRRKLTALVRSADRVFKTDNGNSIYIVGCFRIEVSNNIIEYVYWNRETKLPLWLGKRIKENYKLLGLSSTGNSIKM